MGYGVIGSTSDSGSFSLGSSPGTPAKRLVHLSFSRKRYRPRSSSGLGRRPLTAVTPVQIRYGVQIRSELRLGAFCMWGALWLIGHFGANTQKSWLIGHFVLLVSGFLLVWRGLVLFKSV